VPSPVDSNSTESINSWISCKPHPRFLSSFPILFSILGISTLVLSKPIPWSITLITKESSSIKKLIKTLFSALEC